MPHTNKKPSYTPGQTSPGFKQAQFVNINLTPDQVALNKQAAWDITKIDDTLHGLLVDGFKISARFDQRNACFSAWLIPPDGHKWAGQILSGRGSTPTKAIKQLMFIHYHALESDWGMVQDQQAGALDD